MLNRRRFLAGTAMAGVAGLVASHTTLALAQDAPQLRQRAAPDSSRRLILCSIVCATVHEAPIFFPIRSVPADFLAKQ